MGTPRKTQVEVESYFSSFGYKVHGTYVNRNLKMEVRCPVGHTWDTGYKNFLDGRRCYQCAISKYTRSEIEDKISEFGYRLTGEFINANNLKVSCAAGHIYDTSLSQLNKLGCPMCRGIRLSADMIQARCESNGFTLEEILPDGRVLVYCSEGHYSKKTPQSVVTTGCSQCSGKRKRTIEEVRSIFASRGYTLTGEYHGNKLGVEVICPKGHLSKIRLNNFMTNGSSCHKCSLAGQESKAEVEIRNYLSQWFHVEKMRDRSRQLPNKPYIVGFDIDIYVPSLRKGIEFDGIRYHSFEFMRARPQYRYWPDQDVHDYHSIKDRWFLSKGIEILHIKEGDWMKDKGAQLKRCLEFLNGVPPQELL